MQLTSIEKEVVYLLATKQLIDEMVNFEVLSVLGENPDAEIRFKSSTHQKLFNILLVDLLSCCDMKILGEQQPFLRALGAICKTPNFNRNNSIHNLSTATREFRTWLDTKITVDKIWLPSIDLETRLSLKRVDFIKICGNLSKHSFTRLSGVVHQIRRIFNENNIPLDQEQSLAVLPDFYEWFHRDLFNYHSSAIAEFLNNIRLGIHDYLRPEFSRSIKYLESNGIFQPYEYTYPEGIQNEFARLCYWDLMNEIRATPYMRRFQVNKYLKLRY